MVQLRRQPCPDRARGVDSGPDLRETRPLQRVIEVALAAGGFRRHHDAECPAPLQVLGHGLPEGAAGGTFWGVAVRGEDHLAVLGNRRGRKTRDPEHGPGLEAGRLPGREGRFRALGDDERPLREFRVPGREAGRNAGDRAEGGLADVRVEGRAVGVDEDPLAALDHAVGVTRPDHERCGVRVPDAEPGNGRQVGEALLGQCADAPGCEICRRGRVRDRNCPGRDLAHERGPALRIPFLLGGGRAFPLPAERGDPVGIGRVVRGDAGPAGRFPEDAREVALGGIEAAEYPCREVEQVAADAGGVVPPEATFLAPHLHRDALVGLRPPLRRVRADRWSEGVPEEVVGARPERLPDGVDGDLRAACWGGRGCRFPLPARLRFRRPLLLLAGGDDGPDIHEDGAGTGLERVACGHQFGGHPGGDETGGIDRQPDGLLRLPAGDEEALSIRRSCGYRHQVGRPRDRRRQLGREGLRGLVQTFRELGEELRLREGREPRLHHREDVFGVLPEIRLVFLPVLLGVQLRRGRRPCGFGVFGDARAVVFGQELDALFLERPHVDPVPQALPLKDHVGVPLPGPAQRLDLLRVLEASVLSAPGVHVQEPCRQHDVGVGVAVALVVNHEVDHGAAARVGLLDVAPHQVDLGRAGKRAGQSDRDFPGNPGLGRKLVLFGLDALDVVPETLGDPRPGHAFRDLHREQAGPGDGGSFGRRDIRQSDGFVGAKEEPALRRMGQYLLQCRLECSVPVGTGGPCRGVAGEHDLRVLQLVRLCTVVRRGLSLGHRHLGRMPVGGALHGVCSGGPGDRGNGEVRHRHLPSAYRNPKNAPAFFG